ncbi:Il31, partial [Lemmus lemmus]
GPTKPSLVLLCCIGTFLATCGPSFGAPTANSAPTADMIKTILEHLKLESKELYEDYKKNSSGEVPIDESLQLPCFTLGCEASTSISIIQAYLEEVKRLSENRINTSKITKQLDDITCSDDVRCSSSPKPSISGPGKFYERKSFKLTVLKRFSDCMGKLEAKARVC